MTAAPGSRPGRGLASRLVAGVAVGGIVAACAWADAAGPGAARPMAFLLPVVLVVAAGAGREAARLAGGGGIRLPEWPVACGAAVIAAAPVIAPLTGTATGPLAVIGPAAVAVVVVAATAFVVGIGRYAPGRRIMSGVACGVTACVSIGLPLAFMVALRLAGDGSGRPGIWAAIAPLASLIAVVKAGDVAAYAVGSAMGRHRMAPALSPGKTWEGAVASLLASLAVAWWVTTRIDAGQSRHPLGGWPVFGLLVGVAGMVGDLAESLVKREFGAKDSGSLLGGMGGFLDLVDSLLVAAPVAWLLWILG